MKAKLGFISVLVCGILFTAGCFPEQNSSGSNSVKVYESVSLIPHGSSSYRIEIDGKSYRNVSGGIFLEIPEKGIVCFTTQAWLGPRYLHVVPIRDTQIKEFKIELDSDTSSFGDTLGLKKEDSESTYVDKIEGNKIFFMEKFYLHGYNRYCLNMAKRTLVKIEDHETHGPG